MLVDSHAHLEMEAFDADRDAVLTRARDAGVGFILAIGNAHPESGSMDKALALCRRHADLATTAGIHPHDARIASDAWHGRLAELLREPEVWAVGEIGLDYYYDHSPRDTQRGVFRDLLAVAREADRPVIIHARDADADLLEILGRHWAPPNPGGIMHCFAGDPAMAARCLALGFHISFAGTLTFPKAENVRAAAAAVPPDRLLVETDAPYLAPVPVRGRRNEPAHVRHVAAALARVHGLDEAELARRTTANFWHLFGRSRQNVES
jgi:TatD DNase family protein